VITRKATCSRSSFTLVEMLVTIAVLSLLVLLIFSIVGSSLNLSDSTSREADSSIEGRQILDRIGADIDNMLIRPDVDQFYYSATPPENDKMFFYSQQTGFFDSGVTNTCQTPVSLIGYRINTSDNPAGVPMLERLARGLIPDLGADAVGSTGTPPHQTAIKMDKNGTTGTLVYLTFPARTSAATDPAATAGAITTVWGATEKTTYGIGAAYTGANGDVGTSPYDNGSSPYYDAVGPDVFRFEVCFLLQNGTSTFFSLNPGYTNSAPAYGTSLMNTVAIVVAIAILDSKSRKLVPAASWNKLITALPDPTTANLTTNALMDAVWNNALNQSTFASGVTIPAVAASHIKVYQRYYYLNTPKAQ
jgi:hypothetical protein